MEGVKLCYTSAQPTKILDRDVARVACASQLSHDATASQAQSYVGQNFCSALLATLIYERDSDFVIPV